MKILVIGSEARYRAYLPDLPLTQRAQLAFAPNGADNAAIAAALPEAEILAVDAISRVDADLMDRLPRLRLIQSEGVGYNAIDGRAARARGIDVCNNQGMNAGAVAEQTVLLMLGLLRDVVAGDAAVRAGEQIQTKERMMVEGITELADCRIGLYGFGDIAKETAKRLRPFGAELFYYCRHPLSREEEDVYGVTYLPREELIASTDFVSLHTPVTPETTGLVDAAFLAKMKPTAFLINTGRGELVENEALVSALERGSIAGAGLDTLAPEPVAATHPLLHLSPNARGRLLLSPHIGGITRSTFVRGHRMMWENFTRVAEGKRPLRIVNP